MGSLCKYNKEGERIPLEFQDMEQFYPALKDCLLKMAGPRPDMKLCQLDYVLEEVCLLDGVLEQGMMSPQGMLRHVRKIKTILIDIQGDLKYAREIMEALNGGK